MYYIYICTKKILAPLIINIQKTTGPFLERSALQHFRPLVTLNGTVLCVWLLFTIKGKRPINVAYINLVILSHFQINNNLLFEILNAVQLLQVIIFQQQPCVNKFGNFLVRSISTHLTAAGYKNYEAVVHYVAPSQVQASLPGLPQYLL